MGLNSKGQAAITDAMFLLMIVTGLASFMFLVSGSFGVNVEKSMKSLYGTDYAASALQTILYSSVPRHPNETLDNASEVDYLLAMVKEDYANNPRLSDSTKKQLLKTISTTMQPLSPAYDYLFYIYIPPQEFENKSWIPANEKNSFVFMLIYAADYSATPPRKFYYCNPPVAGKIVSDNDLDRYLFLKLGELNKPPRVLVNLKKLRPLGSNRYDPVNLRSYVSLVFWPSKEFPQGPAGENLLSSNYLNCTEATP